MPEIVYLLILIPSGSFSDHPFGIIFMGGGWEALTENDFVPDAVKQDMDKRTDWGSLLEPQQLDLPEQDKSKKWRFPNW